MYIGDTHVTRYFCVHSVIYAYILEVYMIIAFDVFSQFLDRKVIQVKQENLTKALPEADFLFHEDNLEVKKLLPSTFPPLWVILLDTIMCTSQQSFQKTLFPGSAQLLQ